MLTLIINIITKLAVAERTFLNNLKKIAWGFKMSLTLVNTYCYVYVVKNT